MNVLHRVARAALQCCCRSLHNQANASLTAPDGAGALNIFRISSKALRDAVAAAGPASSGRHHHEDRPAIVILAGTCTFLESEPPHADAADRGDFTAIGLSQACVILSSGQAASVLQMSQVHRAQAEADQPLGRNSLNFLEQSGAEPLYADSVRRKRKTKMNKHKHRKRLKKMRHGAK